MRLGESLHRQQKIPDGSLDTDTVRSLLKSSALRKRKAREFPEAVVDEPALSPRLFGFSLGFGETTIVQTATFPGLGATTQTRVLPTPDILPTPESAPQPPPQAIPAPSSTTTRFATTSALPSSSTTSVTPRLSTSSTSTSSPTSPVFSLTSNPSPTTMIPTAMAESQSTSSADPTVFVTLQPTPGPGPPPPPPGGLSEATEHALIAVGSIGGTIIVLFAFWIFLRMRQGLCLSEACLLKKRSRYENIDAVPPPLGRWSAAGGQWDRKSILDDEEESGRNVDGLARPSTTLVRNNSGTSQRTLQRLEGRRPSIPNTEHWPIRQQSAPSAVPSSPLLPPIVRVTDGEMDPYEREEANSSLSSLPAYLKGAKNIPPRRKPLETSRFSWSNSQAPRTPGSVTTTTDTVPYQRYSIATSRSSIARYRTVDSWVGNQAGRIDEESIQMYLRQNGPQVPDEPVPDMPKHYQAKHRTNLSDATVFRQHPGTEVIIPRASRIPSDVLDGQVQKRVRDDQSF